LAWNYLVNANHAMALIVMTAVWKQISYNFIFFLAGLQAIPRSMFEASAIDGAGPFKTFFLRYLTPAFANGLLFAGRECGLRFFSIPLALSMRQQVAVLEHRQAFLFIRYITMDSSRSISVALRPSL